MSAVTVDLPSVPVTPMTVSCSDGRPNQASAASARARRVRSTTSCGTSIPGTSRSTTRPMAPASAAARREVVAVDVDARHGEEERAGSDAPRVVGELGHLADGDADDALGTR